MHMTIRELAIVNLAAFHQISLEKAVRFRHVIVHLVEDAPGQSRSSYSEGWIRRLSVIDMYVLPASTSNPF